MKPDFADVLTVLGVVSLVVGLWMIYPPLAFVALGLIGISMGLLLASKRGA